jgi:hypothetical protein
MNLFFTHCLSILIAAVKFRSSNAMCSAHSGEAGPLTVDKHDVTVMIVQGHVLIFCNFFCLGSWWKRCKYTFNPGNYWSANHNFLQATHPGALSK